MKAFIIILFLTGSLQQKSFSQVLDSIDRFARSKSDTSNFSVNMKGGWALYNSFIAVKALDSVVVEIIIRHDKNLDFKVFQYIGRIKKPSFFPSDNRDVDFSILDDAYTFRISSEGKCFLRMKQREAPPGDPVIIPFRIMYKK